jgi:hypothetical protein
VKEDGPPISISRRSAMCVDWDDIPDWNDEDDDDDIEDDWDDYEEDKA